MLTELDYSQNCRTIEHGTFLSVNIGKEWVPHPFPQHKIDVPDSLGYHNVDCCHTHVSVSVRLLIL